MTSLALGLAASVCWAATGMLMAVAMRRTSSRDATFWFLATAVALTAPVVIASGGGATTRDVLWLALSGAASGMAMLLMTRALARGRIGTVSPLVALEGPFAVGAGALAGERVAGAVVLGGLLSTLGGALVAFRGEPGGREGLAAGSALAIASAALFGLSLWALAEQAAPAMMAVMLLRGCGLLTIAPGFARTRPSARGLRWIALAALADIAGNVLFLAAADAGSLPVAAVAATQFGSIAALGGFVLWGDRLSRRQVAGIAVLAVGIAIVAAGGV